MGKPYDSFILRMFNMFLFGSSRYYDKKYQVFLKMVEHQREYSAIMNGN